MMEISKSYRYELGDGLVVKTASNSDDIERVAECDIKVFNEEGIAQMHRKLFLNHPNMKINDLIFVEDEKTGKVVSTICFLPWEICYQDIKLKVGEMGIVGTVEEYRRRGLIRSQAEYFKKILNQRGYHLSVIQGIPYFYRQFGYEYSLPLEGGYSIELHQIPDPKGNDINNYTFRAGNFQDIPILQSMYEKASEELDIHTCRNSSIWQYLLEHNPMTHASSEVWMVENNKKAVAYFQIEKHPFGDALTVNEISWMDCNTMMAVMHQIKILAIERNKPNIRLKLPANCPLSQLSRYYGARDLGNYAWQVHVPDMARLIGSIGVVLERRIAKSPFADLTDTVKINLYEESLQLQFNHGKLIDIQKTKPGTGPIRIPPRAAILLIFGYRSREELIKLWPDMGMPAKESYLIDVIFPKMKSWLYASY